MYTFLLILLIIDAIVLATAVLLQAGQGGGLAALGGGTTDMVVGGRQAVTVLTRATWWGGGIFLFLSLLMSVMLANRGVGSSELQQRLQQGTGAPTQPAPLPLENTTPAVPQAPVTGTSDSTN